MGSNNITGTGTISATTFTGAAAAGSLSGTTLNATVVTSSLTSVGTLNNLILGSSAGTNAPLKLTSGTNLSAAAAGAIEYDGTVATLTPNTSLGRAAISTPIFTSGAGTSGITASTNYALFPTANDTITLPIGLYQYQIVLYVSVATSTVSSNLSLNLRGTGNAIGTWSYDGVGTLAAGGTPSQYLAQGITLGSITSVAPTSATAGRTYLVRGSGLIRVTTAGTFIPAYQFSTTQTSGTVTFNTDNYLLITPLASTNAVSTGAWA
jgi:hypothetical protein